MTPFPTQTAKVAVLMGGRSAEREISLMSGHGVLQALLSCQVNAHAFDPAKLALQDLRAEGFTHAFISLHGRHGEDGTVQGALELFGIPYTGSGVMASAVAIDKHMTKRLWMADGLSTPPSVWLAPVDQTPARLNAIPDKLGWPFIVKPPHEGSSIGVSKVSNTEAFMAAVALATQYDPDLLCESFIDGEEVTCPVLGEGENTQALPVVRIAAPQGAYDYQNKYFNDSVKYHCPSGLAGPEEAAIRTLSMAAYKSLGCRGWARVDIMIRARDRQAFLLEINTSPGMTDHSLVPMSAKAAGITYPDLCMAILSQARLDSMLGVVQA
ncbi:MAG: D-alanine--D-alanine ligase [Betaproteobacteria bacterium]|nr:D-alanine--D-alanine ligase [Betaproteobacteria bacterium]